MELFTHSVKKIKGAAHKNGDVDSTCEKGLRAYPHQAKAGVKVNTIKELVQKIEE